MTFLLEIKSVKNLTSVSFGRCFIPYVYSILFTKCRYVVVHNATLSGIIDYALANQPAVKQAEINQRLLICR